MKKLIVLLVVAAFASQALAWEATTAVWTYSEDFEGDYAVMEGSTEDADAATVNSDYVEAGGWGMPPDETYLQVQYGVAGAGRPG